MSDSRGRKLVVAVAPSVLLFCWLGWRDSALAIDPGYCTGLCFPATYELPTKSGPCTGANYNALLMVTQCSTTCTLDDYVGDWRPGECPINEEPTCNECFEPTEIFKIYGYDVRCQFVTGQASSCPCELIQLPGEDEQVVTCYTRDCPNCAP